METTLSRIRTCALPSVTRINALINFREESQTPGTSWRACCVLALEVVDNLGFERGAWQVSAAPRAKELLATLFARWTLIIESLQRLALTTCSTRETHGASQSPHSTRMPVI